MQLADPRQQSTAYLILRHLYDGEVIEWPIADDHPGHAVFRALEDQGYIARWDRTWPRRDRYRLTDRGIAAIEAVYKPSGAEVAYDELRRMNLPAAKRRAYLQSRGYDPTLWGLLHDPSTCWDTWESDPGRYHHYIWEDAGPARRYRRSGLADGDLDDDGIPDALERDNEAAAASVAAAAAEAQRQHHTVDLDREAGGVDVAGPQGHADYDVS
jgi:hypothetical protein